MIQNFGQPFTTEQMFKACSRLPNPISRATLYRILRTLREEGALKDVFLPHGQQVSIYTDSTLICVMECSDCGVYANCPGLKDKLALAVAESAIEPALMAIFLRSPCPKKNGCIRHPEGELEDHSKV
ncbi:hypothetical protein BH09VER1_BH09VER1_32790 [soil metagenome]